MPLFTNFKLVPLYLLALSSLSHLLNTFLANKFFNYENLWGPATEGREEKVLVF